MSILSDTDIQQALDEGNLGIEPFSKKNLTPNGYDLTVEEIYIKKTNQHIKEGVVRIPAMA